MQNLNVSTAKFAVKFCGGCSPSYDRAKLFDEVKTKYPNISFEYADENQESDFLLVICGCPVQCADISSLSTKKTVTIGDAKEFDRVIESINEYIK